jgi:hypothetical protein
VRLGRELEGYDSRSGKDDVKPLKSWMMCDL